MENKNNIEKIIECAMQKMQFINGEQMVGNVIKNENGQTVIPISSITVAIFSGGGEYGDIKVTKEVGERLAGGNATICSIKPNCFIVNNGSGFSVTKNTDILENLISVIKCITDKIK